MNYEGGDTVEPITQQAPVVQKRQRTKTPTPMPMILDAPSSSEGDATEDEDYTAEDTSKGRRKSKVRSLRFAYGFPEVDDEP